LIWQSPTQIKFQVFVRLLEKGKDIKGSPAFAVQGL